MSSSSLKTKSQLLHPSLDTIPLGLRFLLSGVVGNVCFMVAYNTAIKAFRHVVDVSVIYGIVQFLCIILNHFLNISLVFGWPPNYLKSLLANMPVGLSSLLLGAVMTSWLDRANFDQFLGKMLFESFDENSGFFTAIAIMVVTGVYNFVLLNLVNKSSPSSSTSTSPKKQE